MKVILRKSKRFYAMKDPSKAEGVRRKLLY